MEIWKDILGYEGLYQVSSFGRVKSLEKRVFMKRNNCLKTLKERMFNARSIDAYGYHFVGLRKDGLKKNNKVHILVAIAFLNHTPNGYKIIVDHIDNIKANNKLDNLQLITPRENNSKDKWRLNPTSKYTGVSLIKANNKWFSCISINGKNTYLGSFDNELDASKAYQKALLSV